MKLALILLSLAIVQTAAFSQAAKPSFVPGTPADEAAIRAILALEENGDRSGLASDLDWENAFGVRYADEKKRAVFYHAIVDPQQSQSTKAFLEARIEFVEPTVAIADVYGHRVGQIDEKTGKTGADRWLRNTFVFKKENGVWVGVAERIADLRYPWYRHYDAMPPAFPVRAQTLASYAGRYEFASDHSVQVVTVAADHLLIKSAHGDRTLIPTSATDFLAFHPDDLAQYLQMSFRKDSSGHMILSVADESGQTVAVGVKSE